MRNHLTIRRGCNIRASCRVRTLRPTRSTKSSQRGTLRWGGDASGGGPYIYQGPNNKLTGFEFELAEYLAAQARRAERVRHLGSGRCCRRCSTAATSTSCSTATNGRRSASSSWSSTIPYYIYKLQLMTRKDDDSIRSWDDLRRQAGRAAQARRRAARFGRRAIPRTAVRRRDRAQEVLRDHQRDGPGRTGPARRHGAGRADRHLLRPRFSRPAQRRRAASRRLLRRLRPQGRRSAARSSSTKRIQAAIDDGTLERIYEKYGVWNDDQKRLAEVAKNWPPAAAAATSRWANFPHYVGLLLRAAWTTIQLSFLSMPLAIVIGLLVAIGRLYGPRWIRHAARGVRRAAPRHAAAAAAVRDLLRAAAISPA